MSEITKALVKFQRGCPAIIKDKTAEVVSKRTGGKFTYTYADLAGIMSAIRPVLSECGLFLTQVFDKEDGSTLLVTRIMHEAGELIASTIDLPINGLAPQEAGSAITYYRRYSIVTLLGLAADDDDGEAAQKAGATHGKPSTLTQQIKESVAEESARNGNQLVAEVYANDKAYAEYIKEIGGKKYWKTTAITGTNTDPGMTRKFIHDLNGISDIDELDGFLYDNRIFLEVCQIAVPHWYKGKPGSEIPGIAKRISDKRAELERMGRSYDARLLKDNVEVNDPNDPSRYLRG